MDETLLCGTLAVRRLLRVAGAFVSLAAAAALVPAAHGQSKPDPAAAERQLDALVKAAKAEGELTFYSTPTENVAIRIRDAFAKKYGLKVQFLRMAGSNLQQRYSSEAEAGTFVADVFLNAGNSVEYAEFGIKKGWLEPVSSAGIPVVTSGEFPAKLLPGPTAIVQVAPWGLAYNTQKISAADLPKTWPDMLNPKYRDRIIIVDPRTSGAQIDHWTMIVDKFGEGFFTQLRAQNPRSYSGGVPAINALAAGEGSFQVPTILAQVQGLKVKGAPLDWVAMSPSTGVEIQVTLTARTKAKHPNAGRLFANYVMSREGNAVVNDDPGGMTIYDTSRLPKGYESPKLGSSQRLDEVMKLLGFK